jgi:hypothetical protein
MRSRFFSPRSGALLLLAASVFACNAVTGAQDLTTDDCPGCSGVTRQPRRSDTDPTEPAVSLVDGGPQSPSSASPDARAPEASPADAGASPSASPLGSVQCGASQCAVSSAACCFAGGGSSCIAAQAACAGARARCDQPGDCQGGDVCCLETYRAEASCTPRSACAAVPSIELCATDADCANGRSCRAKIEPLGYLGCT